jgi:hypothetical protein
VGQLPTKTCTHHHKLAVDTRNGLLAGPTCPTEFVVQRPFEVLPPQYAAWQHEHPRRAPPSQYSPLCPQRGPPVGAVVVTWPRAGEVFVIEPGYSRDTQSLALTAETTIAQADVHWRIDGTEVSALWPLEPGRHQVEAEVRGKRSARVAFEVR